MTPGRFPANWVAAAQHERDRRAEKFPELIAIGDIDELWADHNYQAWCAIAEWLEQGKSTLLVQLIGWPELEAAAEGQLAAMDKAGTKGGHRDAIWCIHNLLVKQRELIAPTTRKETAWARPTSRLQRSQIDGMSDEGRAPEPLPA